jgi:hypothetical protein
MKWVFARVAGDARPRRPSHACGDARKGAHFTVRHARARRMRAR